MAICTHFNKEDFISAWYSIMADLISLGRKIPVSFALNGLMELNGEKVGILVRSRKTFRRKNN